MQVSFKHAVQDCGSVLFIRVIFLPLNSFECFIRVIFLPLNSFECWPIWEKNCYSTIPSHILSTPDFRVFLRFTLIFLKTITWNLSLIYEKSNTQQKNKRKVANTAILKLWFLRQETTSTNKNQHWLLSSYSSNLERQMAMVHFVLKNKASWKT